MLLDRRAFLKSLGIIGGTTLACNRMAPEEKLNAYLTPPLEMVPGVAQFYSTVCRACPAGCGIWVKTREKRPIKLEGNPTNPINRGKLCARGQAFIQGLYGRSRATRPMMRKGGELVPVSWNEALVTVIGKLKSAQSVGFLGGLDAGSFDALVDELLAGFLKAERAVLEPAALTSMGAAAEMLFGRREVPRVDLGKVDRLVSLGADLLDTWVSPVELARQWAEGHSVFQRRRLEMDYLGPRRNLTAASADRWHRISSGDMAAVSRALLNEVFERRKSTLTAGDAATLKNLLNRFGPPIEAPAVKKELISNLAEGLAGAERGLVLFGGAEVVGEQSTAIHAAALLTNYILGSVGPALRFGTGYALGRVNPESKTLSLIEHAGSGELDCLFICGANPVYALPGKAAAARSLFESKLTVALAYQMDETAAAAHVVLPVHHPLESWGDYELAADVMGLMQPVRSPLFETMHAGDVLMELCRRAGTRTPPQRDYKSYVAARWSRLTVDSAEPVDAGQNQDAGPASEAASFDEGVWDELLVNGGLFGKTATGAAAGIVLKSSAKVPKMSPGASRAAGSIELIVPFSTSLYDGRSATEDWLREIPDSLTQTAWEIPVEVALDVARANGLSDGDEVKIKSAAGEARGSVIVESGLIPGSVAFRPGGSRALARNAETVGNPMSLLDITSDPISGELVRAGVEVTIEKISSGSLTSVMGSPNSEGRALALSMRLGDYRKGRFPVLTRHGEVLGDEKAGSEARPLPMPHMELEGGRPADNMYSLQEYSRHRWGMVVDLDLCIGCGACVVACYAENNIPVVGKEEVAKGRELSWIRIEKHVFERGGVERVRFLPVMCQHCANAPCETVCPVFASSHTSDGLNAQIYNRCIGTRYCSNNCPYKVRRFNYFDYKRERPGNEQLNPDVTVRSRGVMEKCTFCIQRIREIQNLKKVKGEELNDGEIVPACVQTCPTGALSFGDFKRPDWRMSKLARDPRGYRLLDYAVNTRPGVVYLRKVDTEEG